MVIQVPESKPNTRYFKDLHVPRRPALTFVGLDSHEKGGDDSRGYGLKQVLELATEKDGQERWILGELNKIAGESLKQFKQNEKEVPDHNSHVVQSASLMALVTCVLDQNEATIPGLQLMPHQEVLVRLVRALEPKRLGGSEIYRHPLFASEVFGSDNFDRVKWTRSLMNMVRAFDLYLAVENLYQDYGRHDHVLLTKGQKKSLINRLYEATRRTVHMVDGGWGIGRSISGNWPMKMWAAAAYAALGAQDRKWWQRRSYKKWLGRGLRRCGKGDPTNRRRYWSYNTSRDKQDGQRFFGEGPYYMQFAMRDLIPLWHAVRANDKLSHDKTEIPDPFNEGWFVNPLAWMADIATFEGGTPPFDDGNRHWIENANVMQWDAVYGDRELGRKMSWIFNTIANQEDGWKHINKHLLPLQLAIPKAQKPEINPLPEVVGNYEEGILDEEQLLFRRNLHGHEHYVCLHGEGNKASIESGEGHEQPDQLQLLYYIDDRSVIMDCGYDYGSLVRNSRWNAYSEKNVMAYAEGDGGIESPGGLPRWFDGVIRKVAQHQEVKHLYFVDTPSDRIHAFHGQVALRIGKYMRGVHHSEYDRTVFFVADENRPYLIDLNRVWKTSGKDNRAYRMRYNIDGKQFQASSVDSRWDEWFNVDKSGQQIPVAALFLEQVEESMERCVREGKDVTVEECFRDSKEVCRLTVGSDKVSAFSTIAVIADAVAPDTCPVALEGHADGKRLTHQVWTWAHDDVIDVIFARSMIDPVEHAKDATFQTSLELGGLAEFTCPADQPFGFARIRGGIGDPEYLYQLAQVGLPPAPVTG